MNATTLIPPYGVPLATALTIIAFAIAMWLAIGYLVLTGRRNPPKVP